MSAQLGLVSPTSEAGGLTGTRTADSAMREGSVVFGGSVVFVAGQPRPVRAPGGEGLAAHQQRFDGRGLLHGMAAPDLLAAVEQAALSGRGGGHFPVARKWRSYLGAGGNGVLVANAAESEPLSRKDTALLQLRPHLLLDGLAATAAALGAAETVLWMHGSASAGRQAVERAIAERAAAGISDPHISLVRTPDRYLSGESSAIVRSLSGGPALPAFRRQPATVSGVGGLPTLVHNVETLCRIALIARGAPSASTLFTVAHGELRSVIDAIPEDSLSAVLDRAGGRTPVEAVLLGGYGGRWVEARVAQTLPCAEDAARERGFSLGAGVLLPVLVGECGLSRSADIARFLADAGARQCGPCMFGLPAIADAMSALAEGAGRRRDVGRLERFLAEIRGRGACGHPDGAVQMVASALAVFAADVRAHLSGGCCAAS